jgi:hypothetical protein
MIAADDHATLFAAWHPDMRLCRASVQEAFPPYGQRTHVGAMDSASLDWAALIAAACQQGGPRRSVTAMRQRGPGVLNRRARRARRLPKAEQRMTPSVTTPAHDGANWHDASLPNNTQAIAVSSGQDATTYAATATGLLLRNDQSGCALYRVELCQRRLRRQPAIHPAGIRFIVNGMVYFFKHPLQAIEDVISAVATFFRKLGKAMDKVIQALSILFHLDEIMKTHQLLRDELLKRVNGDPSDPTTYPGVANAIQHHVKPNIDSFFDSLESKVNADFNTLAEQVAGTNVRQLKGQGASAHTAFTVKSSTTGQPSNQAVPCAWGSQKLKAGVKSAQITTHTVGLRVGDDPIASAVTTFEDQFRR